MTMQSRSSRPPAATQHEHSQTVSASSADQHCLDPHRRRVDLHRAEFIYGTSASAGTSSPDVATPLGCSTLGDQLPLPAGLSRSGEQSMAQLVWNRDQDPLRALLLQSR